MQDSHRVPPPDHAVIRFTELGGAKFRLIRQIGRYHHAEVWVYRRESLIKPFFTCWLLRIWSRRTPLIVADMASDPQKITVKHLARVTARYVRNRLAINQLLRQVRDDMAHLEQVMRDYRPQLDLELTPLYLRADLIFGLRSGGAVGHIAGVLNNLDRVVGKPLFVTTDTIPTVRDDIPTHRLIADGEFSDFGILQPIWFTTTAHKQIEALLNRHRVAFIYQRYTLNNYTGLNLALRHNVPFVLEYNGSEIWAFKHWGGQSLPYEDIAEATELLNLRAATLITVVSQPIKEQLIARGIAPEKILVNPNAVNTDHYRPDVDGSALRARYGLQDKRVIGFIGTFGAWHGAEVLAEAFGRLMQQHPEYRDHVRLLMIGDGAKMPLVKQYLDTYGVRDLAVLTGLVPQEQGAEHLAAADILASPHVPNPDGTRFFGSPTKLFEYMAMGRGIVASDLDQIGEILEHDRTAWKVRPGDPDDLAAGLKVLLDDPSRSDRLGAAARQKVVAEFTWQRHTQKIIEALKAIMKQI
jgi:glycosyltransferase involved in cell wall biosynthesis